MAKGSITLRVPKSELSLDWSTRPGNVASATLAQEI